MVAAQAPPPAQFLLLRYCLWCSAGLVVAGLLASLSVLVQSRGFAPLGLFSLLVGVALGLALLTLARQLQVGHVPSLVAGAVALGLTLGLSQHALAFRSYRLKLEQHPASVFMPAEKSFGQFMADSARDPGMLLVWLVDLAVIVAVAAVITAWGTRGQAYCNRCCSWYAPRRSGSLAAGQGPRLADVLSAPSCEDHQAIGYELRGCRSGCGPWELRLSWKKGDGQPAASTRLWLDAHGRQQVELLLDET